MIEENQQLLGGKLSYSYPIIPTPWQTMTPAPTIPSFNIQAFESDNFDRSPSGDGNGAAAVVVTVIVAISKV